RPQQPGTEFAPFACGPVRDHSHYRIETGHTEPDDEEQRSGLRCCQTKRMSVKVQLQGQHRLKHEVRGHVTESIASLFTDGEFLNHRCLESPDPSTSSR